MIWLMKSHHVALVLKCQRRSGSMWNEKHFGNRVTRSRRPSGHFFVFRPLEALEKKTLAVNSRPMTLPKRVTNVMKRLPGSLFFPLSEFMTPVRDGENDSGFLCAMPIYCSFCFRINITFVMFVLMCVNLVLLSSTSSCRTFRLLRAWYAVGRPHSSHQTILKRANCLSHLHVGVRIVLRCLSSWVWVKYLENVQPTKTPVSLDLLNLWFTILAACVWCKRCGEELQNWNIRTCALIFLTI